MGIDKIKANVVAVGRPNKHDLGKANQLLVDFLKKKHSGTIFGFSCYWNKRAELEYTINLPHVPDHVVDPKVKVCDYPINFEDWRGTMKTNHVPIYFILHDGPKLVCSFEYSLANMKSDGLGSWFSVVQNEVHEFYNILKDDEGKIVPGRELNLLWGNGHTLFIPEAFRQYIKKNENSGLVGYLGGLSD